MNFYDYDPFADPVPDYDEDNICPGCDLENDCECDRIYGDRYEDDFNGPMDSDYGDSESDHVWADLARSEAE